MKERPEPLVPACNKVNDDLVTTDAEPLCDDAEITVADAPPPQTKGRVIESIRSLVQDFVDYTKKTDF